MIWNRMPICDGCSPSYRGQEPPRTSRCCCRSAAYSAKPEDVVISRDDAEDLHVFVYAIVEYVYDLTDRYNEFKERTEARAKRAAKAKEKQ
jgi:hypothetical protein